MQPARVFRQPAPSLSGALLTFNEARLKRGQVRAKHEGITLMAKGTVKWFNATKGYGFIEPAEGGKDVFIHISALERAGLRTLQDGQAVTYEMGEDQRGRTSAENIVVDD